MLVGQLSPWVESKNKDHHNHIHHDNNLNHERAREIREPMDRAAFSPGITSWARVVRNFMLDAVRYNSLHFIDASGWPISLKDITKHTFKLSRNPEAVKLEEQKERLFEEKILVRENLCEISSSEGNIVGGGNLCQISSGIGKKAKGKNSDDHLNLRKLTTKNSFWRTHREGKQGPTFLRIGQSLSNENGIFSENMDEEDLPISVEIENMNQKQRIFEKQRAVRIQQLWSVEQFYHQYLAGNANPFGKGTSAALFRRGRRSPSLASSILARYRENLGQETLPTALFDFSHHHDHPFSPHFHSERKRKRKRKSAVPIRLLAISYHLSLIREPLATWQHLLSDEFVLEKEMVHILDTDVKPESESMRNREMVLDLKTARLVPVNKSQEQQGLPGSSKKNLKNGDIRSPQVGNQEKNEEILSQKNRPTHKSAKQETKSAVANLKMRSHCRYQKPDWCSTNEDFILALNSIIEPEAFRMCGAIGSASGAVGRHPYIQSVDEWRQIFEGFRDDLMQPFAVNVKDDLLQDLDLDDHSNSNSPFEDKNTQTANLLMCGEPAVLCKIMHLTWPEIPLIHYLGVPITAYTKPASVDRQRWFDDFVYMNQNLPHIGFVSDAKVYLLILKS